MPDLLDCLGKEPWYETVLFSNTMRNILKYFSQHRPIETETWWLMSLPVMEFLCAWLEWGPKYLSVSLLQLDSLPCHKMPHAFLCWDCTAICFTRGLLDTTWVPQAIPQLELAIYYLALSIISRRCFSKCGLMLSVGQMNYVWPINYMNLAQFWGGLQDLNLGTVNPKDGEA